MKSSFRARLAHVRRLAASVFAFAAIFAVGSAQAVLIPIGVLSFDVTIPGSTAQFDITNLTGPNASPPDFPVTTAINLSSVRFLPLELCAGLLVGGMLVGCLGGVIAANGRA